jgi:hypothetical protein
MAVIYRGAVNDAAELSPERCAALIAPDCERLTFAVVRMAVARGAAGAGKHGLPAEAMTMFAQLRTGLLARSITAAGLAAVYRYRHVADVQRDVQALQAAKLLDVAVNGDITATDTGRRLLIAMYAASAAAASQLWRQQPDTVTDLNRLAGQIVDAAVLTGGEAFAALAPPYEPADAGVELLLHHRLSVLRYHRADAHAAAWHAAGQTAATIAELPAGAERNRIEAQTNRMAAIPYTSLTSVERRRLLNGLVSLPG